MKKRRKGKMSVKKVGDTTVVKYTMKLNKKQKAELAVLMQPSKPSYGPFWSVTYTGKNGVEGFSPVLYSTEGEAKSRAAAIKKNLGIQAKYIKCVIQKV